MLARLKTGRKRNGTEGKANKELHLSFRANVVAVAFARQKAGEQVGEAVEEAFNEAENKETKIK